MPSAPLVFDVRHLKDQVPMQRVYVDTNVLKFAATALPRYIPRKQKLDWGGNEIEVTVHEPQEINPNLGIKNDELKAEAEILPTLANLSKEGRI